jgi:chloramphenicol 3-O-phosphotransferase
MQALRELLALFDIEVNDGELKKADKSLDGLEAKVKHVMGIVGEVFLADRMFEFVKGTIEADSHLQELASRLDVSAHVIRNFGLVAQDAGVDLEAAANSLGLLQKNLGEAETKGGETAAAFAKLGVALKEPDGSARDLQDVIADVADGMAALPDQNARAAVSMQLFGRAGRSLVPILSQGSDAFRAAMTDAAKLGNALGDDFYKDVKEAQDGYEHFAFGLASLKDRAIAAVLPAIDAFGKVLQLVVTELLELDKNTHLVQATFVTVAAIVGVLLVDALASATAAAWALIAPLLVEFGPIIAIVGGLVWVFQDLAAMVKGDTSVLGDFIEQMVGVQGKQQIVEQLKELWSETKAAIRASAFALGYFTGIFAGVGETIAGSGAVKTFFLDIIKLVMSLSRLLVGLVQALAAIPQAIQSGSFEPIGKAIDKAGDAVFGKGGILGDLGVGQVSTRTSDYGVATVHRAPQSDLAGLQGLPDLSVRLPGPAGAGAGSTSNAVHQENKYDVNVYTSSDQPQAVGAAVGKGVASYTAKDLDAALAAVVKP